jgi:hypothetical protein
MTNDETVESRVRLISVIRGDARVSLYGSYEGQHQAIDLPTDQWERMVDEEAHPREERREAEKRVFAKLFVHNPRNRPRRRDGLSDCTK